MSMLANIFFGERANEENPVACESAAKNAINGISLAVAGVILGAAAGYGLSALKHLDPTGTTIIAGAIGAIPGVITTIRSNPA